MNGRRGYYIYEDPCLDGASIRVTPTEITLIGLFVKHECQGKGVGTKFLQKLKQLAKANNCKIELSAEADTRKDQKRLERFYKRQGFKRVKGNTFRYVP